MFCKNCSKKLDEGSKLCISCGAAVADSGKINVRTRDIATILKRYKRKFLNMTSNQQLVTMLVIVFLLGAIVYFVIYLFQNNPEKKCIKMMTWQGNYYSYRGEPFPTMNDAIRHCMAEK